MGSVNPAPLGAQVDGEAGGSGASGPSKMTVLRAVAKRSEFAERKPVRVKRDGYDIVCVLVDGAVYAFKNSCPHTGYKLHEARIRGCVVTCLSHLAQFDLRDGSVLSLPVEGTSIETGPLAVYRVVEDGDEISVEIPKREPE
jgi:3-phenylpropionate/trans-cinnamate dioxygenase ferredoxin subunit